MAMNFDVEFNPETALTTLRKIGWRVPTANPGNEALAIILERRSTDLYNGSFVVPDDDDEMLWQLFFGHLHQRPGFPADLFTSRLRSVGSAEQPGEWSDNGNELVEGLSSLWGDRSVQTELRALAAKASGQDHQQPALMRMLDLLSGPKGNTATKAFSNTFAAFFDPNTSCEYCEIVLAYLQNAATLNRHGASFRNYLQSIAPDIFLPATDLVGAEQKWEAAITQDFVGVSSPKAKSLLSNWLFGLWREGHIEWFESHAANGALLEQAIGHGILPDTAGDDFPAYCQTLRLAAEWIPSRYWWTAFYSLPPRFVEMSLRLELRGDEAAQASSSVRAVVQPITDSAEWPHRTWDFPPYKSADFMNWVDEHGGLSAFRESPAYSWAEKRGLIVDDAWSGTAADFPSTLGSGSDDNETTVTGRLNAWVEIIGAPILTIDNLARLHVILQEGEFSPEEDAGLADPVVFIPVKPGTAQEGESPLRLDLIEGIQSDQRHPIIGVFTTLIRLHSVCGQECLARKSHLSDICRLLTESDREDRSFETIVINPGQPGAVALPPALVNELAAKPTPTAAGPLPDDSRISVELPEEFENVADYEDEQEYDIFAREIATDPPDEFNEDRFKLWVTNPFHGTGFVLYAPDKAAEGYPLLHRAGCPVVQADAQNDPAPTQKVAFVSFDRRVLYIWLGSRQHRTVYVCAQCRADKDIAPAEPTTPLEKIICAFFSDLNLTLTRAMLAEARSGFVLLNGMSTAFAISETAEGGPFFALHSSHRMCGDTHVRRYASGETERLPGYESLNIVDGSLSEAEQEIEYNAKCENVMRLFKESGFQ